MKWLCDVYKCFSVTKSYFEQAECKCFTEIGIVHKGYINPELQDLAMQFFFYYYFCLFFFTDFRQACHSFKNRLAAVDILDRVDYLSYVTERYD